MNRKTILRGALLPAVVLALGIVLGVLVIAPQTNERRTQEMDKSTRKPLLTAPIPMPEWLWEMEQANADRVIVDDEEKMRFVVDIAVENVRHGTGGPFAAAIFEIKTNRLIALGINSVVPAKQSWAHAEMTAFAHAQNKLDQESLKGCMLVTSCEPCAMCSGATPWSGVERVIYGAPRFMAEKVGFDEGYKGEHWEEEFAKRKIQVAGPMLGEDAYAPFKLYTKKHGEIY